MNHQECRVLWTINNFCDYSERMNKLFEIEFSSSTSTPITWSLKLQPFSRIIKNNVSILLNPKEMYSKSILAILTISIINRNNQEGLTSTTSAYAYWFESIHVHFEREKLFKMKDLIPDDSLIILCKLRIHPDGQIYQNPTITKKEVTSKKSPELRTSLESKLFTDVTLLVEDKEIAAHKHILCLHSDVFLAMFNTQMKEQKTNRVIIEDLTFEAVRNMVRYFYGVEIPPQGDNTGELYKAADKYNVEVLKWEIEKQIIENVTPENACDLVILAHNYNITRTKEYIRKYVFSLKYSLYVSQ